MINYAVVRHVRAYGFRTLPLAAINDLSGKLFLIRKRQAHLSKPMWKDINFGALDLEGKAKILLNPKDNGFTREFYLYGFREPLNTCAYYYTVKRLRPSVLDIGSNLGYFPLIALQAGARNLIAIEPIPLTFEFLIETLKPYQNTKVLHCAVSDNDQAIRLYLSEDYNVASTYPDMIRVSGRTIVHDLTIKARSLMSLANEHYFELLRMDIEGHEYKILAGRIPDSVKAICLELHVIPPWDKDHATKLLNRLRDLGFRAEYVIREMDYGMYPLVAALGLKATYRLVRHYAGKSSWGPKIQANVDLIRLADRVQNGITHLFLRR